MLPVRPHSPIRRPRLLLLLWGCSQIACRPGKGDDTVDTSDSTTVITSTEQLLTSTETSTSATTLVTTTPPTSTSLSSSDMLSTGNSTSLTSDTSDSESGENGSCHVWLQDCPAGQKCYRDPRDPLSEVYQCVQMVPSPGEIGSACEIFESVDSCGQQSRCMLIDESTGLGTCVPTCVGKPGDFSCPEQFICHTYDTPSNHYTFCDQPCDPLAPVCPPGGACLPLYTNFTCQDNVQPSNGLGESCDNVFVLSNCKNGLLCSSADSENCADDACCTSYCDLNDPNPCLDPMQVCIPYGFDPDWTHIGYCRLPG